jgi:hypothetical protein
LYDFPIPSAISVSIECWRFLTALRVVQEVAADFGVSGSKQGLKAQVDFVELIGPTKVGPCYKASS